MYNGIDDLLAFYDQLKVLFLVENHEKHENSRILVNSCLVWVFLLENLNFQLFSNWI